MSRRRRRRRRQRMELIEHPLLQRKKRAVELTREAEKAQDLRDFETMRGYYPYDRHDIY